MFRLGLIHVTATVTVTVTATRSHCPSAPLQVTLGEADVPDVEFTAFRTDPRSVITAALPSDLPVSLRAAVKAELLPANAAGTVVSGLNPAGATIVDGSGFFELRGVKQGSYVLRLSCGPVAVGGPPACGPWEAPVQVWRHGYMFGTWEQG